MAEECNYDKFLLEAINTMAAPFLYILSLYFGTTIERTIVCSICSILLHFCFDIL